MTRQTIDNKIDKVIGNKVYQLRLENGWSRTQVVKHIGVSNQQLLKYENGTNKISTCRLTLIAKVFGKPLSYFYEDNEGNEDNETIDIVLSLRSKLLTNTFRNFLSIKNPKIQRTISNLIKTIVKEQSDETQ